MKIIRNEEISDVLFCQMIRMDHEVWTSEDESFLPTKYLYSLYRDTKEAMFFAVDDDNNLIGYQTVIFLTEKNFEEYYRTGAFTCLKNIGMHKGKNILYIYTANVKPQYQGTQCMKEIGKSIAEWLEEKERDGCFVDIAYAEAVSMSGIKTIQKGFEMEAMSDVDEEGFGHYVLRDGMKAYRRKMLHI